MPASFPEVWLNRVRTKFTTQDQAPWLEGVEELNVQVIEVGSGTSSESNLIHLPFSDFDPEVLINNTTYPIALQAFDDDETIIQLDKYQTKVTTLSDDQIDGAAYDTIDAATKPHVKSITKTKYRKAIHAIAPGANAADTPVLECTGATVGARKRMTYEDLVAMKSQADALEWPEEGRRVVLSSDHYNDLLLSTDQAVKTALVNFENGKVKANIAGWEIFSYVANPSFTSAGAKVAFGAVPPVGARKASVFYSISNLVKKTGKTKQYFAKAEIDPETQVNKLNYRHYYICLPARNMYIGASY